MSETNEDQQGFQSFHFRIWSLVLELKALYGTTDVSRYIFDTTRERARKSVKRNPSPPIDVIESRLRRGWSHLLSLHRDAEAPDFYAEINAWTPAKAWYAIHHDFTALLPFVSPGAKRLDHDLTTSEAAKLVARQKLLPPPFSHWVLGAPPETKYPSLEGPPQPISNLSDPRSTEFADQIALLLRSTAEERLELRRRKWLRENPQRKRLSPGTRKEWARALKETTIFDFMYRLRLRVNYQDADTFVVGAPSDDTARWFAGNLLLVTDSLMAAVEAVLCTYVDAQEIIKIANAYGAKRRSDSSDPVGRRLNYLS